MIKSGERCIYTIYGCMEFFSNLFGKSAKENDNESIRYPVTFSLAECREELVADGFTLSPTLLTDVETFGLKEGIVLALDGNSGLRIVKSDEGVAVIKTFNGLFDGKDPLSKLAKAKYDLKPIHL